MSYQLFNASRALMIHHAEDRTRAAAVEGYAYPLIINPMILEAADHKLPEHIYTDVIFVDFNKDHPLAIPKGVVFHGDVVISQSILRGIASNTFKKDLYIHDTDFDFNHAPSRVDGRILMSESTFEEYQSLRKKVKSIENRTIALMGESALRTKVESLYHDAEPLPFDKVVEHFDLDIQITSKEYLIQGSVYLHGPYPYQWPDNLVIKGDLIVFEEASYQYPTSMVVEGSFDIRGSL